jgi:hypothetical protein
MDTINIRYVFICKIFHESVWKDLDENEREKVRKGKRA